MTTTYSSLALLDMDQSSRGHSTRPRAKTLLQYLFLTNNHHVNSADIIDNNLCCTLKKGLCGYRMDVVAPALTCLHTLNHHNMRFRRQLNYTELTERTRSTSIRPFCQTFVMTPKAGMQENTSVPLACSDSSFVGSNQISESTTAYWEIRHVL